MPRDIEAGRAFIRLSLTGTAQVKSGIARLTAEMRSFAGFASRIGATLGAISLGAGFIASIKAASDMQETMSKFNVVFGESAEAMKKWGDDTAAAVGRSKKQIASFLASSQDLLVPLGFDPKQAEQLSKEITKLAIDLGSFNNIADEDVFRDLQAALTGSGEVMKKYGVVVSEARVKQELLNKAIDPKVATEAQKAMARFQLILQGTTAAQGDAIRTSDSFANQWKKLQATIADTSVQLGEKFLPLVTQLISSLTEALLVVGDFATTGTSGFDEMTLSAELLLETLGSVVNAVRMTGAVFAMLQGEGKKWSAEWNETISELAADLPGKAARAVEDTFRETAKELREQQKKLMEDAEQLRDTDFRELFRDRLQQQRTERKTKSANAADQAMADQMTSGFRKRTGALFPPSRMLSEPAFSDSLDHDSKNTGSIKHIEELLRIINRSINMLSPPLEAAMENSIEASRHERENEANQLRIREIEHLRRIENTQKQMLIVMQNLGPIGIIRGGL